MAPVALKRQTAAQAARLAEIKLTCSRIREKQRDTLNAGVLQTRIESINEIWSEARQSHAELMARDGIETDPYVIGGIFRQMQIEYEDALDYFVTLRDELQAESRPVSRARSDSESDREFSRPAKLPRIDLPEFSGKPEDWESFSDSFTALVHKARGLDNTTKLQYLKSCLTGDAAEWVREVSVTNANYLSTWEGLRERFYNPRVMVNNHLDALANLPFLPKESATDLRTLAATARRIVTALGNLSLPVEHWDVWLVHTLSGRLDPESRKLWEAELSKRDQLAIARVRAGNGEVDPLARFPTLRDLTDFLVMRSESLKAATRKPSSAIKAPSNSRKVFHAQEAALTNQCVLCAGTHPLAKCHRFLAKSPSERRVDVRRLQRCFNCFGSHRYRACPSNGRCNKCRGPHHSLIHTDQGPANNRDAGPKHEQSDKKGGPSASVGVHTANVAASRVSVILATAQVNVIGPYGTTTRARALLDQGSETTFVSESLAQLLELPRRRAQVALNGVGGSKVGTARAEVTLTLQSRADSTYKFTTEALVLPRLTSELPSRELLELDLGYFADFSLADPQFHQPGAIDLILGADLYGQLLRAGVRRVPSTRLVAQNTALGWIVSGAVSQVSSRRAERVPQASLQAFHSSMDDALQDSLQQFWLLEEVPQAVFLKPEDEACEKLFAETHKRDATGRYVVRLPVKGALPRVAAETRRMAHGSLNHMHRRFARDPELARTYEEFMVVYEQLGHMSHVPSADINEPSAWYLPHHAVTQTTKLRVVFDASRQTSEHHCLNEFLSAGPPLQRDLSLTFLNWRRYQFAFTADIVKMFRQIRVAPSDRNLQRIVWSPNPSIPPKDFYLNTVTYGTACAPYLAIRTLKQLACDERSRFPRGAQCLESDTYVDDTFAGDDDLLGAIRKRDELIDILGTAGIQLDKWAANNPDLLPANAQQHGDAPLKEIDRESSVKTLGVQWSPSQDEFRFSARNIDSSSGPPTKRSVLSNIAQLFDPLGWLSPVTVIAKILMQDLWILKCDWDSPLPSEAAERWHTYNDSLNSLSTLSVKRWLGTLADQPFQIHGFSDASSRAYAAAVYIRLRDSDGQYRARLLAAKSKVAPVKTVSIPNLELCGASLLVKLVCHLQTLDFLREAPIYLWSDSEIVLKWLSKHPCHWKTFVANRVSQIQTELPAAKWAHVPTKENPADIATRGSSPADLHNSDLWWYGPAWLSLPSESWPQPPKGDTQVLHAQVDTPEPDILQRFSNLTMLIRVVAYCRRPLVNLRRRKSGQDPLTAQLTTLELAESRMRLIGLAQAHAFSAEISLLHAEKPLSKGSALRKLYPVLRQEEGILRVGGRLSNSNLSFERKHPPILPRKSALSRLFVRHAHETMLHAGPTLTSAALMQHAWILGARQLVKSAIHNCVRCQRVKPRVASQMLGDLPATRVTPARPFTTSGVDYAGPFQIRTTKGRGYRAYKGYIALFVCFATRAIHLELVSDLTTATFIAAYKRFTSRRGVCKHLYSDNSTTFRGADRELQSMFSAASEFYATVSSILANDGTTWSFIPPTTPHYGGLWEAGVKSAKHHLKRAFGEHTFTFEEFTTVLTEIEACLNSRPLSPLTADIDDLNVLTPAHFLIGSASGLIPDEEPPGVPENRLDRFKLMQRVRNQFWKRWSSEYLQNLQERGKWRESTENIAVGQLVLLRDDRYPPAKWPLGRVIEVHPGTDGLIRVVTVKTATNTFRRHIARLSPLSIESGPRVVEVRPTDEGGRNVRSSRPLLEFLPKGK